MVNDPIVPDELEPGHVFSHPPEGLPAKEPVAQGLPATPVAEPVPLPPPRPSEAPTEPIPAQTSPGPVSPTPDSGWGLISSANAQPIKNPEIGAMLGELDSAEAKNPEIRKALDELNVTDLTDPGPKNSVLQNWSAGFVGKLLERTEQGIDIATDQSLVGPIKRLLGASVRWAAENAPPEAMAEETRKKFVEYLNKSPGTVLKDAARKIGLQVDPEHGSLAGEIGSQTVDSLLMLAGTAIIAPTVGAGATAIGLARSGNFINKLGLALRNNPIQAALLDSLFSTPGGVIGEKTGGPLGGLAGSLAGGITGTVAYRLAKGGFMGGQAAITKIADLIAGKNSPAAQGMRRNAGDTNADLFGTPNVKMSNEPIQNSVYDANRATGYAKDVIDGEIVRFTNETENAISRIKVPPGSDPRAYQVAAFKGFEQAEAIGQRIKNDAWKLVDKKKTVPMKDDIWPEVKALQEDIKLRDPMFRPDKEIDDILAMGKVPPSPKGEPPKFQKAPPVTVEELLSMEQRLFHSLRNEEGAFLQGRIPRQQLIATINELRSIIYRGIQQAHPTDHSISVANDVSSHIHDIFSRGNIPKILSQNRLGEAKVDPEQTVDFITSKFNGMKDALEKLKDLKTMPGTPGQPFDVYKLNQSGTKTLATTQQERAALTQTQKDMEDAIRAKFHESVQNANMDPKVAQKLMKDMEKIIPANAKLATELERALPRLTNAIDSRTAVEKSAFAKFSGRSGEQAVTNMMNSGNPAQSAKEVMVGLKGNADAVQSFQDGIIGELFLRSRDKPLEMRALIKDPKISGMLDVVFGGQGSGNRERLERVVGVLAKIEAGDITTARKYWMPATLMLGRFGSGAVARQVGQLTGGSTIQGVSAVTETAKTFIQRMWGTRDPSELMKLAVRDPVWEKFVLSQDPATTEHAYNLIKTTQRLVRWAEGARQYGQGKFGESQSQGVTDKFLDENMPGGTNE